MNFLELVNNLIVEAAVSGHQGVQTVEGDLQPETARLRMWVHDAWLEIQAKPNYWGFHFKAASMVVPLNASVLRPPEFSEVAEWDYSSFRMADAGKGRKDSHRLQYQEFFYFRDHAGLDATISRRPDVITVDWSNESLIIAPPSDAVRTLWYDYWRTPQELTKNTDIPIMPRRFHKLIVAGALEKYGYHESAPEAIAKADQIQRSLSNELHMDQGIGVTTAGLIDE